MITKFLFSLLAKDAAKMVEMVLLDLAYFLDNIWSGCVPAWRK